MTQDTTSVPPYSSSQNSNDRLWSVLCHLSFFFGLGLISFLFPLIVYLVMTPHDAYVRHHAREALNFHLSLLLYFICAAPLCLIVIGFPLVGGVIVLGLICSVVAAFRSSQGIYYSYPLTIPFVKA